MREQTHRELTRLVARETGWPAELANLMGEEAATPDRVHVLAIDGLGCKPFGYEAFCLCHFGLRRVEEKGGRRGFTMTGYRWKHDATAVHLDLPNRNVIARPEQWRWPVTPEMRLQEPLYRLASHGGLNLAADEVAFPAASTYADWEEWCIGKIPRDWGQDAAEEALAHFVAFAAHKVQDLAQPFHAVGLLLGGHAAFEGDQQELFLRSGDSICARLKKANVAGRGNFRAIATGAAGAAYVAPGALMDDMLRPTRRALRVSASVALAVGLTAELLTYARKTYLEKPRARRQV